jgi:hypothetical protein
MDSNLTGIVGSCHSLRLGGLQLWIFFLFLHKPVEFSWLPRFNEVTTSTKSVSAGAGLSKHRGRHSGDHQWPTGGRKKGYAPGGGGGK